MLIKVRSNPGSD